MNTDDLLPHCSIIDTSPRATDFFEVFGRLIKIPIKSWLPTRGNLPDKPNAEIYMLDLQRITPDERSRLIQNIAARFNLPAVEVAQDLTARGCPILGDDITVAIPLRLIN